MPERIKVVVIGGTGHVGSYLCPRLAANADTEVVCISRGQREPYPAAFNTDEELAAGWANVERLALDREADMTGFCAKIVALQPTHIIDMICFTKRSCKSFVEGLLALPESANITQFIHVGSIWSYGPTINAPTTEDGPFAEPLDDYGIQKRAIEHYLLRDLKLTTPTPWTTTVFHPGHIVGRGWPPLNPQGHFNPASFLKFKKGGETVVLPNLGAETVHHIHAEDICTAFLAAMAAPDKCAGQAYSIVSPQAISLRGFAHAIGAEVWGSAPPKVEYKPCPSPEFEAEVGKGSMVFTMDHIVHSPCSSIQKLQRDLGVTPKWSSVAAVGDAVKWLEASGTIETCWYPGQEADTGENNVGLRDTCSETKKE